MEHTEVKTFKIMYMLLSTKYQCDSNLFFILRITATQNCVGVYQNQHEPKKKKNQHEPTIGIHMSRSM